MTGMNSVGTHFLFMGSDQDYDSQITLDFCGERLHLKQRLSYVLPKAFLMYQRRACYRDRHSFSWDEIKTITLKLCLTFAVKDSTLTVKLRLTFAVKDSTFTVISYHCG